MFQVWANARLYGVGVYISAPLASSLSVLLWWGIFSYKAVNRSVTPRYADWPRKSSRLSGKGYQLLDAVIVTIVMRNKAVDC